MQTIFLLSHISKNLLFGSLSSRDEVFLYQYQPTLNSPSFSFVTDTDYED